MVDDNGNNGHDDNGQGQPRLAAVESETLLSLPQHDALFQRATMQMLNFKRELLKMGAHDIGTQGWLRGLSSAVEDVFDADQLFFDSVLSSASPISEKDTQTVLRVYQDFFFSHAAIIDEIQAISTLLAPMKQRALSLEDGPEKSEIVSILSSSEGLLKTLTDAWSGRHRSFVEDALTGMTTYGFFQDLEFARRVQDTPAAWSAITTQHATPPPSTPPQPYL